MMDLLAILTPLWVGMALGIFIAALMQANGRDDE